MSRVGYRTGSVIMQHQHKLKNLKCTKRQLTVKFGRSRFIIDSFFSSLDLLASGVKSWSNENQFESFHRPTNVSGNAMWIFSPATISVGSSKSPPKQIEYGWVVGGWSKVSPLVMFSWDQNATSFQRWSTIHAGDWNRPEVVCLGFISLVFTETNFQHFQHKLFHQ